MDLEQQQQLVKGLRSGEGFPHPVNQLQIIETHISWVILTGDYAYKIKKAVDFGFLDFSTLEQRRFFCAEELRLNRRLAPQLYLDVVGIGGSVEKPVVGTDGDCIEYAVKMQQFNPDLGFDQLADRQQLSVDHIDQLAITLCRFHHSADIADPDSAFGEPSAIAKPVRENFHQIRALVDEKHREQAILSQIESWSTEQLQQLHELFKLRKRRGQIRECHGDLHLGNITLYEDQPVVFDCIEFNKPFRWIDTISDIAFLCMDLKQRGLGNLASRLLNRYLQESGDYGSLRVLQFYLVYRAMVRAKVAYLRHSQAADNAALQQQLENEGLDYMSLALKFTRPENRCLIITHGMSGSGKSLISGKLIERLGAIRIRSDVERKRLHGLQSLQRSGGAIEQGIYSADAGNQTYDRLSELATSVVAAGMPVILDATFLKQRHRQNALKIAQRAGIPFLILNFHAPEACLRKWIRARAEEGRDPSDADESVLDYQLSQREPLTADEESFTVNIDTEHEVDINRIASEIIARCGK